MKMRTLLLADAVIAGSSQITSSSGISSSRQARSIAC